jgi:LPXTG-motif cell wall-anchored protein
MKKNIGIALLAMMVVGVGALMAQTTTYEIKQGEVLHVYGSNLVVKMADGTVRDVEVPEGFMFNVDGQQVPVGALKPGTKLTSTKMTTTTPHVVKTTEVREATVVQRIGQTLIYRDKLGQIHKITGIPEGFELYRNGKKVPIEALAGGDRVTAHIVHKEESIITEEELNVAGAAPKPKPAPRPAPVAQAAPAPAPILPKTGSNLPLIGLMGLCALVLGLGIAAVRR